MPSRTTALASLAAAAAVIMAAGASTGTVLFQSAGNETGLAAAAAHRQDAAHRASGDTADTSTGTTPELPACPTDVKNHGAYVSSVAKANHGKDAEHGKPADTDTNHGALVSAAAQSDCGKTAGADDADTDENETPESEAPDSGATSHGKSGESHGKSGQSHGQSGEHLPSQAPVAP